MPYGRRSKLARISFSILSSLMTPVPNVVTEIDVGSATPIAYDTCTSQRRARPAATMFFAT